MNVLLLNNPKSGRGTGAAAAQQLADTLRDAGHPVRTLAAGPHLPPGDLVAALGQSDLLVVAGGDGTLHHALSAVIQTGKPFYHFPLGTENLFTREFGMDARPETLLRALDRWRVRGCDAGVCNNRLFSLMVGIGFDAGVVERLAAQRTGGTSRGEYLRHALEEFRAPRIPHLRVTVDGRTVISGDSGMALIANSRQYAARLDPARGADMSDGLLDIVFLPYRNAVELASWLIATAAGSLLEHERITTARGRHIELLTDAPTPHQIDGEAAGMAPPKEPHGTFGFDVHVLPGALQVLVP